jgi:hypothetical protein
VDADYERLLRRKIIAEIDAMTCGLRVIQADLVQSMFTDMAMAL